ncbi:MAG TPA: ketosynthase chain-length factor, partial [Asanoa sp.]|nr:ketosynthase chain-length factor [Asanoa sp.]
MTRAVITGIGVIAPSGLTAEEHWRSTLAGELHVGYHDDMLKGQVSGFAAEGLVDPRLIIQTDRW